ncbi:MAG: hypothetical protein FJ027_00460 [Candidatus Rokubacteria bacterium]|nr:hypothetical protein [Candidatus Rokubacteria bacterium]
MIAVRPLAVLLLALALAAPAVSRVATAQPKALDELMMDLNIAPLEPMPAPPLNVTTVEGVRISLGEIRDQAVLVYFWATW